MWKVTDISRQIPLSGSMVLYVSELAEVIFRLIRSSCDWYSSSFSDTTMASGFMKWVCQEFYFFCNIVRKQVFDSKQSFTVIAECMQSTLEYCKQVGFASQFFQETKKYNVKYWLTQTVKRRWTWPEFSLGIQLSWWHCSFYWKPRQKMRGHYYKDDHWR